MPEQLLFTRLLNQAFHGPVAALLQALHIEPMYPQAPITNAVAMEVLVVGLLLVFFVILRTRLSVETPGGLQHVFEGLHGFVEGQSRDVIGPHSERFTPFLMTLGLFILIGNLFGVVPGLESPTATPVVPLGCALCVFIYYHAQGIRESGFGYIKHFLGPSDPRMSILIRVPVAILMLILEPISHLARLLSLTVRLYGNMFAGDMVILVFFSLIPIAVPVLFIGLHIAVALIQAYVFVLLATVYLAGAVAGEH
ncbi:MAG TPA: F0F1 ATP synthase subunit A [Terriglobales bacterium]|jgi:F-type H+-transporting ATPase subunit a